LHDALYKLCQTVQPYHIYLYVPFRCTSVPMYCPTSFDAKLLFFSFLSGSTY
jgi:hypothetical protein